MMDQEISMSTIAKENHELVVSYLKKNGLIPSADFENAIDGSWGVVNYNNIMGWKYFNLSGSVFFIDKSIYIVGNCYSQPNGHPAISVPFSITYEQATDLFIWNGYKIASATAVGSPIDIKYDVDNKRALLRTIAEVRDPATGMRLLSGGFVIAKSVS